MHINQTGLEELQRLADYLSDVGILLETDYPTLAGILAVYESGARQPTHDLARWPLVDGVDCSPENVKAWIDSSHAANGRALMWSDKYLDLLGTIRSRAEDVLREVSELER